jgi:hypothetical protein
VASFRTSVEPVLGTRMTMRIDCAAPDDAALAEEVAIAEADRLESILTAHRADSPFNRWRRPCVRGLAA